MRREDQRDDDAPPRLVRALRALVPPAGIPAEVDAAILDRARRTLLVRRRRRLLLWRVVPLVAAASLALWFALGRWGRRAVTADVDGSGRVDIVDAYVLALRIEEGRVAAAEGARWDLNRDGALDRRDVDLVASAAVRIGS